MFMTNLSIISRYSRTYFERKLNEIHVGFTEQLILMYLNKSDAINQENIAKHFLLDKGAIAKALNKLEEKEYIIRMDNPNNRREKLISITDKGQSIIQYMNRELQEWHDYLFEGLSQEEIEQFSATVAKISANAAKVIHGRKIENEESK